MLELVALYLSLFMAIFLFAFGYLEAIKISEAQGKVYGGTLIFCFVFALIFSRLTFVFS